eukprot:gene14935-4440_t
MSVQQGWQNYLDYDKKRQYLFILHRSVHQQHFRALFQKEYEVTRIHMLKFGIVGLALTCAPPRLWSGDLNIMVSTFGHTPINEHNRLTKFIAASPDDLQLPDHNYGSAPSVKPLCFLDVSLENNE